MQPAASPRSRSLRRSSELAATPPATASVRAPSCRAARTALLDQRLDHGLAVRGGHVGGAPYSALGSGMSRRR